MINMPKWDKRKQPLVLQGCDVILHEISPDYFKEIVNWRNDFSLNKYLNQSFKLTMKKELEWYENIYLTDVTQGYMIMLDKRNHTPFGTIGWTDYDKNKRRLVEGRIMRALPEYKGTKAYREAYEIIGAWLYQYVDIMYAHVVKENIASIKLHESLGFKINTGDVVYPHELIKGNMSQYEFFREKRDFINKE